MDGRVDGERLARSLQTPTGAVGAIQDALFLVTFLLWRVMSSVSASLRKRWAVRQAEATGCPSLAPLFAAGLSLPSPVALGWPTGPILPWDIAGAFDNLTYQLWLSAASILWQPHVTMMAISYVFSRLAETLTAGILPLVLSFATTYIRESNVYAVAAALAVALAGLGLAASYLDLRVVDLRQFIKYAVLAALVLSQGPALMSEVEGARRGVAAAVYERAYATVGSERLAGAFSAAPTPSEPWARFDLTDYDPAGYSAFDVALSALEASPAEALLPGLPSGFTFAFFPHTSITDLDATRRAGAIQAGWHGVMRLVLAYPLSVVAVVEALMEVVFSAAGMTLLTALPFALVFGFFLPTEAIVTRLLRQYMMFFANYVVVSMLVAVGVSGLVAAASRRSLTMMAAGAVLSGLFYFFGLRVAGGALRSSFTAFTGSVAQALNVETPERAARRGMGTAVGLAGAGVALAGGAPFLAPAAVQAGQSLTEGGQTAERMRSLARTGLSFAGGFMMQGSALAGPAAALSAMQAAGGADGEGMLDRLTAADAVTVGLSSRTPWGAVFAFDRAARRKKGPSEGRPGGAEAGDGTAPPARTKRGNDDRSRTTAGRREIAAAADRYGRGWLEEIALAVRDAAAAARQRGELADETFEGFVDGGRVALATEGGRRVFDALSEKTRATLKDEGARQALRAMIQREIASQPGPHGYPRREPEWALSWHAEIETAVGRHGSEWATSIAEAICHTLEQLERGGVPAGALPSYFVDRQGALSLASDGAQAVIDRLGSRARKTLDEPQARRAVLAMVGDRVMPRAEIRQRDVIDAIADVVDAGGAAAGADAVAERLDVAPEALGSAYGPISALVGQARGEGMSGADIHRASSYPGALAGPMGRRIRDLMSRMPDRIPVRQVRVEPAARREGAEDRGEGLHGP